MVIMVPFIPELERLQWLDVFFCSSQGKKKICLCLASTQRQHYQAAEPFRIADLHTFSRWQPEISACESTIPPVITGMQLELNKFRITQLAMMCAREIGAAWSQAKPLSIVLAVVISPASRSHIYFHYWVLVTWVQTYIHGIYSSHFSHTDCMDR